MHGPPPSIHSLLRTISQRGKLSFENVTSFKSVAGFSLEFALLNPSGFFFYSVYSVGGRVDSELGTGDVSADQSE